jgi:hypothetical protein
VFNFAFMQRRAYSLLAKPLRSSSHGTSPKPYPSVTPTRTGLSNMRDVHRMVKGQATAVSYYAIPFQVAEFRVLVSDPRRFSRLRHANTLSARIG